MEVAVYFKLDVAYTPERMTDLLACDAIHLTGGDTFYFLHWLRQRGMLSSLQRYVAEGGLLIGVSAGAILMTANIAMEGVNGESRWKGITIGVDWSWWILHLRHILTHSRWD